MKYRVDEINIMEFILKMDEELNKIEVRGDSVEHLYVARIILKKISESLIEEKEDGKENGQ